MFDESGLSCLGADEDVAGAFDYMSVLKKEGPEVLSTVAEELKKSGQKPADTSSALVPSKPSKGGGKSWLTKPVLGPLPGWAVLLLGVGVFGGAGFGIYKLVK
jgi:hypothetical protein